MTERDDTLSSIMSAKAINAEERVRREAFAAQVEEAKRAEDEARRCVSPEERELAELIEKADAVLYTSEKAVLEYLPAMPAELHDAREALREQVRRADVAGLLDALARIERVLGEAFDPNDPSGPLGAALGVARP